MKTMKVDNAIAKAKDWEVLGRIVDQADSYYRKGKMSEKEVERISWACAIRAHELTTERDAVRAVYRRANGIESTP